MGFKSDSSGHTIQDEGVALPARTGLNFIGAGVTAADNAGADRTDVTITSGGGSGTVTHTVGALTANRLVLGNAADDITVLGSLGTATTVLHGNVAGPPTFGAVSLTAEVSGILPSANGGTGNGFTAFTGPTTAEKTFTLPDASATLLYSGGALGTPSSGVATNLTGLPLTSGVTGILPSANGGTGIAYFAAAGPTATRTYTFPDQAGSVPLLGVANVFTALQSFDANLDVRNSSVLFDRFSVDSTGALLIKATEKAPPAVTVSLAGAGAGNVDNGTHSYKITWVTAGGETDAGSVSNVVTVTDKTTDGKVTVPRPTGYSLFVTGWHVYRRIAGDTGSWLKVTTAGAVAIATATYTDNIADGSLGAAAPSANTTLDARLTVSNHGTLTLDGALAFNVFINSGNETVTGQDNVGLGGVGSGTLGALTTGFYNTAVGARYTVGPGKNITIGTGNSLFGSGAGNSITEGNYNTVVGYLAGDNITTGSNNIVIGNIIDLPTATLSNTLNIGNVLFGAGLTGTGTTIAGNIGIGTTDLDGTPPIGRLTVKGSTNDGSTNIFVGRDSDEANVISVDTNGAIHLPGATSGEVILNVPSVAGTTTFTLPGSNGTNKYALTTNGSGVTSWAQLDLTAGVTGVLPTANGGTGIAYFTAAGPTVARIYTFPDAAATMLYSGGPLGTPSSGSAANLTSFPTLNQNTTGSAATLTTPRGIYGNNFDGSAALTGIIASTYGGTGNGFTKFSGPTTAEKTFTLPDASATLLYSGGALGTPSSGVATNLTGLPLTSGVTGILPSANGGTGIAYFTAAGPTAARVYTFPDAAATINTAGIQEVWIDAASMIPRITNGPSRGFTEQATNKNNHETLDFDTTTQEFAQFKWRMPKSWNLSTVTFIPIWTAASGSGGVVFGLAAVATSNNDALDVAFGTAQTSTDTLLTASYEHEGPASAAITIAGTPAASDLVTFQINRTVADGGDTLAVDAKLMGIILQITTNAANDA